MIGAGPIAVPFRNGGLSPKWEDWIKSNGMNITMNTLGLLNFLTGGTINFDLQNLTPVYGGGWLQSIYRAFGTLATGYYTVIGLDTEKSHEINHIWQSRMFGNLNFTNYAWQFSFMLNYFWEGTLSALSGAPFFGRWSNQSGENNWYEIQGYTHHWF